MTTPTKTSIIFAGEIFDGADEKHPIIRNLDGEQFVVRVRAMPARKLGEVLNLVAKEGELLELVSQRALINETNNQVIDWLPVDAAFVDNLDDLSHELLYEAAKRQNFTRAVAWGNRQIAAQELQAPLRQKTDEMVRPLVKELAGLLISSLPRSESPAAPATKS